MRNGPRKFDRVVCCLWQPFDGSLILGCCTGRCGLIIHGNYEVLSCEGDCTCTSQEFKNCGYISSLLVDRRRMLLSCIYLFHLSRTHPALMTTLGAKHYAYHTLPIRQRRDSIQLSSMLLLKFHIKQHSILANLQCQLNHCCNVRHRRYAIVRSFVHYSFAHPGPNAQSLNIYLFFAC